MTMLEEHRRSLRRPGVLLHEFFQKYKAFEKIIYGFVEGPEDPSFYRNKIETLLPSDWKIDLIIANQKELICEVYYLFKWDEYPRKRILFFIDRDLSDYLAEPLPSEDNFFITDYYSIENYLINKECIKTVLHDIYNIKPKEACELEYLLNLFFLELKTFEHLMTSIMGWILYWRKNNFNPFLDNIDISDLFSFKSLPITTKTSPRGYTSYVDYIHAKCKIQLPKDLDITPFVDEFKQNHNHIKFIRGKYLIQFATKLLAVLHTNITSTCPSITKRPPTHTTLCSANFMTIVGPRSRLPDSLRYFFETTFLAYISANNLENSLKQ